MIFSAQFGGCAWSFHAQLSLFTIWFRSLFMLVFAFPKLADDALEDCAQVCITTRAVSIPGVWTI